MPARIYHRVKRLLPRVPRPPHTGAGEASPPAPEESGSTAGGILGGIVVFLVFLGLRSAYGGSNGVMPPFRWSLLCLTTGIVAAAMTAATLAPGSRKWVGLILACVLGGGAGVIGILGAILFVLGGGGETGRSSGTGWLFEGGFYGAILGSVVTLATYLAYRRGFGLWVSMAGLALPVAALVVAVPLGRADTVRQGQQAERLLSQFLPTVLVEPGAVRITEVKWEDLATGRLSIEARTQNSPAVVGWYLDCTQVPRDMASALSDSFLGLQIGIACNRRGWDALSAQALWEAGLNPRLIRLLHGPDSRTFTKEIYLEGWGEGISYRVSAPRADWPKLGLRCDSGGPSPPRR